MTFLRWISLYTLLLLSACLAAVALVIMAAPTTWTATYAESEMTIGVQLWQVRHIDLDRRVDREIRRGFLFWNDLRLSPDGRWIVGEVPDGNLAIASAYDHRAHSGPRVIGPGYSPAWSPDSRSVAYEHGGSIYVRDIRADGYISPARLVGDVPVGAAIAAAWSPGGEWLAFEVRRFIAPALTLGEIYVVRPDGRDLRLLTGDFAAPAFSPIWAPDNRRITFVAAEDSARSLWWIDIADGSMTRLTSHGGHDHHAVWAPDGRHVAYLSDDDVLTRLLILDTHQPLVTDALPLLRARGRVHWSPDSTRLAFIGLVDRNLYTVRADRTGLRRIPMPTVYRELLP